MKKIKFLSLFLVFGIFLFCGCGELNNYLKLTSTNITVANLYFKSINTKSNMHQDALQYSTGYDEELNDYNSNIFAITSGLNIVICVYDYILLGQKNTDSVKIYEKEDVFNSYNHSYYVVKKNTQKIFTVKFLTGSTYAEASLEATYSVNVKSSDLTNTYSFDYKDANNQKCEASAYYNPSNGYMNLEINAYNSNISDEQINTKVDVCVYRNNCYGTRVITSFKDKTASLNQTYVWECLEKDFSQKGKYVNVISYSKYRSLKKMEEKDFAEKNKGDGAGFTISNTSTGTELKKFN